jgi:bifunctional N-acetylglucosamine-1-phosphate-uridyltransferase/glucosamine-1-phosphate-acetyltransferase GlmU-like protein
MLDDPTGYGRIVRDATARCLRIVEEKRRHDDERHREINTGFMAAPTAALKRWLPALGNDNAQGEYYLTDIVRLAIGEGMPVATTQPDELGSARREQQGAAGRTRAHPPVPQQRAAADGAGRHPGRPRRASTCAASSTAAAT